MMVHLNRIYTRTGDDGLTSLRTGARLPKTNVRVRAYGAVDELNSFLGVAVAAGPPEAIRPALTAIQNDLFDLGADLCVPESDTTFDVHLRVTASQVAALEQWIDEATARLAPLTSFVLPGGSPAAAHLHVARTVCRRVEIAVLELAEQEPVNRHAAIYLNRLSDLLFVWARLANDEGRGDVLWVPGKSRTPEDAQS